MGESSGGPPPQVPAGTIVYAVGDLHGCRNLLEQMIEMIRADREMSDARRCVVIYVGDYIDRGPDSKGVIDLLLSNPLGDEVESVFLRGNHEDMITMMLDEPDSDDIAWKWEMNGGEETVHSYGGYEFSKLRETMPDSHLEFINGLELYHIEGSYLFVHAGIQPGVPLEQQTKHDLTWIRYPFLESEENHGLFVVHGHTPVDEPEERPNRLCIDTGAFRSGVLTAVVLEEDRRRFLQTKGGAGKKLRFSP